VILETRGKRKTGTVLTIPCGGSKQEREGGRGEERERERQWGRGVTHTESGRERERKCSLIRRIT
jgi:hypothetical protein